MPAQPLFPVGVHRSLSKGTLHTRQGPLAGSTGAVWYRPYLLLLYLSLAGL